MLLWLRCRPVATALTGPLAWEPPYAAGAALEKAKRQKIKKMKRKKNCVLQRDGDRSIEPGKIECQTVRCGYLHGVEFVEKV